MPISTLEAQAEHLAYLFADELGQSRQEYVDNLPRFSEGARSYNEGFYKPILVQPPQESLSLKRILDITEAGYPHLFFINWSIRDRRKEDFSTPRIAYATWVHTGRPTYGKSREEIDAHLNPEELIRAGTLLEAVFLSLSDPAILGRGNRINARGSRYGLPKNNVMRLRREDGAKLIDFTAGRADNRTSWIIASREIAFGRDLVK